MNWKEINKKNPKAFDLFFKWFKGDPKATMKKQEFLDVNDIVVMHGSLRELYDFFDKQGILIVVTPEMQYTREIDEDGRNPHYVPKEWGYDIHDSAYLLESKSPFDDRVKAEKDAFEHAFPILEKQLN